MGGRRPGHPRTYARAPQPRKPAHPTEGFTVTVTDPNRPQPVTIAIDPAHAGAAQGPASDLCAAWVRKFSGGSWTSAKTGRWALHRFFRFLAASGLTRWDQVAIDLLERAEADFSGKRAELAFIWDCLRHLPKNSAYGVLPEDVRTFLKSPPNTPRTHILPTEALAPAMLRDVLRAAMNDVTLAEHRIRNAGWDGASQPPRDSLIRRREVIAFYVLLCFEWSHSPDVIKTLSFDPTRPTSVQDWGDIGPAVTVNWVKRRGGRRDVAVLMADKEWRAGALLRRLRDATAATRHAMPREWSQFPWVCAEPVPPPPVPGRGHGHQRYRPDAPLDRVLRYPDGSEMWLDSAHALNPRYPFLFWCQEPRKEGLQIAIHPQYIRADQPQVLHFRAIRPAAKWAKFQATGKGLLLRELADDNTVEVLAAHYLNNEVAMRDIGEAWMEIPTLAEEVARGLRPTALDRQGRVVSGKPLPSQDARRAVGQNRVGVSGCRDPYDSPILGERKGFLCGVANRSCYFCGNSVVTPDDIPVMKAYLVLAEKAVVNLSPPEWQLHWGMTVRWIRYVMPLMDPDWETLPIAESGLFDLGLEAGAA